MKILLLLYTLILWTVLIAAQKRVLTVEDLWAIERVQNPRVSPDGKWIAYTVTTYFLATNKKNTDIFLVSVEGGEPRQVTTSPAYDGEPRWSPDGKKLAFISSRHGGETQIFTISMDGGEAQQASHVPTGVSQFEWSPDGQHFLIVTEVYPDMTPEETAKADEKKDKSPVKAKVIDRLLYRHWNRWTDGKYSHVFLMSVKGGPLKDLTPGPYDCPPISLGGKVDFTISPDGKTFYFVRNTDSMVAISTNNDIFSVPLAGGEIQRTAKGRGNDNSPVCSPDGRYLAYLSMEREGFEADQTELMLLDLKDGQVRNLTEDFDRDAGYPVFSPDGQYIYFEAENHGRNTIYRVKVSGGTVEKIVDEHSSHLSQITSDGKKLIFLRQAVALPFEIFSSNMDGSQVTQLTFTNKKLLDQIEMRLLEDFWFQNSEGWRVHGLLVRPPHFDPNQKYPAIFLIHGGPQGAWSDEFHYRWNLSLFASPGYVVIAINFRASKGYGQKFCDQVSKDWGGAPYRDLMEGLDAALQKYPFIDQDRIGAAGASYGGYMVNWIAGHTDRFKCLISHAGVFELFSKYGSTEELWFPEWEFKGTPYLNPELYDKFSPARYVKNFRTPTLVIHGEQDFRVPVTQGLQMFTALQRQRVPSRLIYFPDEGHFITKPQNAKLWWSEVHGWFKKWLK
jgi:dipeptidyl aminopeptidase/acylaminoacyl peptidase